MGQDTLPKLTISVPGTPVPKGRPRMTRFGDTMVARTPKATRDYEQRIALAADQAMRSANLHEPLTGPLAVYVCVCLPIPASWPRWRRAAALRGHVLPQGPSDLDNTIKTLDALNGIIWKDDSQIAAIHAVRVYAARPGMLIRVNTMPMLGAKANQIDLENLLEKNNETNKSARAQIRKIISYCRRRN